MTVVKNIKSTFTKNDVDSVLLTLRKKIKESDGIFHETLSIKPDGSIVLPTKEGDPMVSLFAHLGSESVEELKQLASEIEIANPTIHFTFEKDPEDDSLKWSVTELHFNF